MREWLKFTIFAAKSQGKGTKVNRNQTKCEEWYGEMEKAERNSVYLRKLDRGLTQVRAGHGVVKSMTELEAMEQMY